MASLQINMMCGVCYITVYLSTPTLDNASQDVIQVYVFIHAMWLCAMTIICNCCT